MLWLYGRAYITIKKGTEDAIQVMRMWIAQYSRPFSLRVDSGPAYRDRCEEVLKKLGVAVQHSSAYSPQSYSMAKRFVRTTKDLLKKNWQLNQIELDELVLCANARVQHQGKASALWQVSNDKHTKQSRQFLQLARIHQKEGGNKKKKSTKTTEWKQRSILRGGKMSNTMLSN